MEPPARLPSALLPTPELLGLKTRSMFGDDEEPLSGDTAARTLGRELNVDTRPVGAPAEDLRSVGF
jgi:hypothetical protein